MKLFLFYYCNTHFIDSVMGQRAAGKCQITIGLHDFRFVARTPVETQVVRGFVVELAITAQDVFRLFLGERLGWLGAFWLPVAEFVRGFIVEGSCWTSVLLLHDPRGSFL